MDGFAAQMLAAAVTPHEYRKVADELYTLGDTNLLHGNYAAAATLYEAAHEALLRAGPPTPANGDRPEASEAERLTPCEVLCSMGFARERQGDILAALRCFNAALDSLGAWPEPPSETAGGMTPAMKACLHLWRLHTHAGDAVKARARARQMRSLLDAAGVAMPSDTPAYLHYAWQAIQCEQHDVDPDGLLAAARRVHPWPSWELGTFLREVAYHAERTGDGTRAVALAQEAVALARLSPGGGLGIGYGELVKALDCLATAHLQPSSAAIAPPAAKSAALRALEEAAACFTTREAQLREDFANLLYHMASVCPAPAAQGVIEARVVLHGGATRVVSLHEPDGQGRIALAEEAVRIFAALRGDESPTLLPMLTNLARACCLYRDVLGANEAAKRALALATRVLRPGSPALADARWTAECTARNLATVLSLMRGGGGRPVALSRRSVQLTALAHSSSDAASGLPVSDAEERMQRDGREEAARQEGALARASVRRNTPCTCCGKRARGRPRLQALRQLPGRGVLLAGMSGGALEEGAQARMRRDGSWQRRQCRILIAAQQMLRSEGGLPRPRQHARSCDAQTTATALPLTAQLEAAALAGVASAHLLTRFLRHDPVAFARG